MALSSFACISMLLLIVAGVVRRLTSVSPDMPSTAGSVDAVDRELLLGTWAHQHVLWHAYRSVNRVWCLLSSPLEAMHTGCCTYQKHTIIGQ